MSWNTAPVMYHSGNHSCLVACAIIALFIATSESMITVVTPELFILVTMIGACSCASASSPNVVPLLVYGLSVVSVPPYLAK